MKKLFTWLILLSSTVSYAGTFYGHCLTQDPSLSLTSSCHKVSYHWPVYSSGRIGQTQKAKANSIHEKHCHSEWINILKQVNIEIEPKDVNSSMHNTLLECEKSRIKASL